MKRDFISKDYIHGKTKISVEGDFVNISQKAFAGDKIVKKIEFCGTGLVVEKQAFMDCPKLNTVVLPKNCRVIESQAFCGCSNLAKIVLPPSLVKIEQGAFKNCKRLSEIQIPDSVKYIEGGAFEGCPKLCVKIAGAELKQSLARSFYKVRSLQIAPQNKAFKTKDGWLLSRNGKTLFAYIKPIERVKELKIPEGVTKIESGVFARGDFKRKIYVGELILPTSLEEICANAFSALHIREIVVFKKNLKKIAPMVFASGNFDFSLCPNANVARYGLPKYAYCSRLLNGIAGNSKIRNPLRSHHKSSANPLHIEFDEQGLAHKERSEIPQKVYEKLGGDGFRVESLRRCTYFCRELMRPFYLFAKSTPEITILFDGVSYQNILHFFWSPKICPKFWKDYPDIAAAYKRWKTGSASAGAAPSIPQNL